MLFRLGGQPGENEVDFLPVVLPAILSLAPFIFVRGRKTCVDMCFTFSFFFFSDIAFCYDFWNTKFVWYNTAKISKGVQCIILPASVVDLFVCVFGWYYL